MSSSWSWTKVSTFGEHFHSPGPQRRTWALAAKLVLHWREFCRTGNFRRTCRYKASDTYSSHNFTQTGEHLSWSWHTLLHDRYRVRYCSVALGGRSNGRVDSLRVKNLLLIHCLLSCIRSVQLRDELTSTMFLPARARGKVSSRIATNSFCFQDCDWRTLPWRKV